MAENKIKTNKTKSLTKNSFFYLIYNVLNVLFPFITGIYVARILLPESIGEVAYAQNIVQYFVILSFLGIPTYGLREISKARKDGSALNKVYTELMVINTISTSVFLSCYLILIFAVPSFRANIVLYLIVGGSIALNFLNNSWLFEGVEEFTYISIRNIIFKVVSFILLVVFVRQQDDYLIYAGISVIGSAGNYILNIISSRKFVKLDFHGLTLKRHLKPIFYLVAVNLAIEIYSLVDVTMLGIFCEKTNVAYYTYASRIHKILLQIVNTFTMVIVPRISLYYKEGKIDEFNELLTKTLKIIFILAIPMIVGIQFVSPFLITKMYGDSYIYSANVLRILCVLLLISPIGYLLGSRVLLVSGHEKLMLIAVGSGAVVNVIGNGVLIPYLNEVGAALASVMSELVVMVIYVSLGKKVYKLKSFIPTLIKIIIASAIMAAYLFGISYLPINEWLIFAIQFIGAVLIYFGCLLLTRESIVYGTINNFMRRLKKNGRVDTEGNSGK